MKYKDPITGEYKELFLKTSDTYPIGAIAPYGGEEAPVNWLICDGSAVSRSTYADLFKVIGTSFGAGDGNTTFNLPDLRSRIPLGLDNRDEDFDTIGKTYGEKEHTLTIEEMPKHTHNIPKFNYATSEGNTHVIGHYQNEERQNVSETGEDKAHNIVQPSLVVNYIIKAGLSVGILGNITSIQSNSTKDTYSCDYINSIDTRLNTLEEYSEKEQIIGKWIDDKPIYRKIIKGALTGTYTENNKTFTWIKIGTVIDRLIRLDLNFDNGNDYIFTGATSNDVTVSIRDKDEIQIGVTSDVSTGQPVLIVLEYTKATD